MQVLLCQRPTDDEPPIATLVTEVDERTNSQLSVSKSTIGRHLVKANAASTESEGRQRRKQIVFMQDIDRKEARSPPRFKTKNRKNRSKGRRKSQNDKK